MQQIHWQTNASLSNATYRIELWNSAGWMADLWSDYSPGRDHTIQIYFPLLPAGSDYRLRVVDVLNPQLYALSAQPFTVTGSPVCVRAPNGGETWQAGQTAQISWESNINISGTAVRLELWKASLLIKDFGLDWSADGINTKTVDVPMVSTSNYYRIRATSVWDPTWFDDSDATFTILGTKSAADNNWTLYR